MPADGPLWPPAICLCLLRRPLKVAFSMTASSVVPTDSEHDKWHLTQAALQIRNENNHIDSLQLDTYPAARGEPHRPCSWRYWSNSPTKGHHTQPNTQQSGEKKGQRGWVAFNSRHSGNGSGLNSYIPCTFVCLWHWCPSCVTYARCRANAPTTHPHSVN